MRPSSVSIQHPDGATAFADGRRPTRSGSVSAASRRPRKSSVPTQEFWFYLGGNNKIQGPHSPAEMKELYQKGLVSNRTKVRWLPYSYGIPSLAEQHLDDGFSPLQEISGSAGLPPFMLGGPKEGSMSGKLKKMVKSHMLPITVMAAAARQEEAARREAEERLRSFYSENAEWMGGVLPLLAQARAALLPKANTKSKKGDSSSKRESSKQRDVEEEEACKVIRPLDLYTEVYTLDRAPLNEEEMEPPIRGAEESAEDAERREQTQLRCASYILPRSGRETEKMFSIRLKARLQTRENYNKKPHALVLPGADGEEQSDFEKRMELQAGVPFTILPKGQYESAADFSQRLEAMQDAKLRSAKRLLGDGSGANSLPPPLVLPRGEHESGEIFASRLDLALGNGQFPLILPQAIGESDEEAASRLKAQRQLKTTIVYPKLLDVKEDSAMFEARLKELLAPPPSPPPSAGMKRLTMAKNKLAFISTKGISTKRPSMRPTISFLKRPSLGGSKGAEPSNDSGAVWRPPSTDNVKLLEEESKGVMCGCCG